MPQFSVVVPVHNGAGTLPMSLAALGASDLPRDQWELIVVDDASTDGSAALARGADRLLTLPAPPRGPAHARNVGADAARGEWLVFLDADVCLHADALRRIADVVTREVGAVAVFGAYDTHPAAPGVVSQYRNLLHHCVHAQSPGEAETFWAGCGAIRRDVFVAAGGFDAARYPRPQIEDIELGIRLRAAGHRIVLRPEIQGTHLKRWTLRELLVTDVRDRGIPWMRLWLATANRARTGTLNLRPAERIYTALAGVGLLALLAAAIRREPSWLLATAMCAVVILAGNLPILRWFGQQRGFWFAARVVPLRLLYYALNAVSALAGGVAHGLQRDRAARGGRGQHPPQQLHQLPQVPAPAARDDEA